MVCFSKNNREEIVIPEMIAADKSIQNSKYCWFRQYPSKYPKSIPQPAECKLTLKLKLTKNSTMETIAPERGRV